MQILQESKYESGAKVVLCQEQDKKLVKKIYNSSSDEEDNPEKKIYDLINKEEHPNICKMLRFEREESLQTLVLEYIPFDLEKKKLEKEQVKSVFRDILLGLAFLHSFGIIHGDLKPANILFDGKKAKICDFGLSIHSESGKVFGTHEIITLPYRPPELVLSPYTVYGIEVDIWAIGCILSELFSGKRFFSNSRTKILEEHSMHRFRPKKVVEMTSEENALLRWILTFEPSQRPNAFEILENVWLK